MIWSATIYDIMIALLQTSHRALGPRTRGFLPCLADGNGWKWKQDETGWWLGHPSEKYESHLGWLETQYFWENKIDGNQTTNQWKPCGNRQKSWDTLDFHMLQAWFCWTTVKDWNMGTFWKPRRETMYTRTIFASMFWASCCIFFDIKGENVDDRPVRFGNGRARRRATDTTARTLLDSHRGEQPASYINRKTKTISKTKA